MIKVGDIMKSIEELAIEDLLKQIARLSKEKAIMSAFAAQKELEIQQLKQELSPAEK